MRTKSQSFSLFSLLVSFFLFLVSHFLSFMVSLFLLMHPIIPILLLLLCSVACYLPGYLIASKLNADNGIALLQYLLKSLYQLLFLRHLSHLALLRGLLQSLYQLLFLRHLALVRSHLLLI